MNTVVIIFTGELGKLLSQGSSPQLELFLSSHHDLSWLHFVGIGEYEKVIDYEVLSSPKSLI